MLVLAMARKRVLYIQFYQGELAKIERRALLRVASDIAHFTFVSAQEIKNSRFDLSHDFDNLILGPAPLKFPEECSEILFELAKFAHEINFPTLGIGFGHLILAKEFKLELKNADLVNTVQEYSVRNSQSSISPVAKSFWAYINMTQVVASGSIGQVVFDSNNSDFAAIEFNEKMFGIEFIPYLDEVTFRWWIRPYPDFWLNLTGFWGFKWARENKYLSKVVDQITQKLFTAEEWKNELQLRENVTSLERDFSTARSILRKFISVAKS